VDGRNIGVNQSTRNGCRLPSDVSKIADLIARSVISSVSECTTASSLPWDTPRVIETMSVRKAKKKSLCKKLKESSNRKQPSDTRCSEELSVDQSSKSRSTKLKKIRVCKRFKAVISKTPNKEIDNVSYVSIASVPTYKPHMSDDSADDGDIVMESSARVKLTIADTLKTD